MGDRRSRIDSAIAVEAASVVRAAQRNLQRVTRADQAAGAGCRIVDKAADRLVALERLTSSEDLARALLDWRDRLSSHVLAARATDEIGVDPDVAAHLLERGLVDVAAEIDARRDQFRPELSSVRANVD